jgi:hypothetical protein
MSDTVMPIEVLREIRDAVEKMSARLVERIDNVAAHIDHVEKSLGARIDNVETSLGGRIDQTNTRLDILDRRVTQGFIDTNTKLADLTGEVRELRQRVDVMGDRFENFLTGEISESVRDLKSRMTTVERQLASGAHERQAPYGEKPK